MKLKQKLRCLWVVFLLIATMETYALSCDFPEEKDKILAVQKPLSPIETLVDDLMLKIFLYFNQKDVPPATKTSQRWNKLMNNNQLWKGYAKRAFVIMNDDNISQNQNYKAIVRDHCLPSFIDLGNLNGGIVDCANGVNFDGSVIVGNANDGAAQNHKRAFRWTPETGMKSLGTFNGGTESGAYGVSFDGSVIVGLANDGAAQGQRAFRWTHDTGLQSLGTLGTGSKAYGTNLDGSVIIGQVFDNHVSSAFRWTQDEGMKTLGSLNNGAYSYASGINFDGSVIVGVINVRGELYQDRVFRWTHDTGLQSLGTLGTGSRSNGTNFDGSVIVGEVLFDLIDGAPRAFRWTHEEGMKFLGTANSIDGALDVSFDGSVIVGYEVYGATHLLRAFRWTAETGIESVEKLLIDKGLLPPEWTLTDVTAITPNGVVLIGNGSYKIKMKNGDEEILKRAWRAVIPRTNLF